MLYKVILTLFILFKLKHICQSQSNTSSLQDMFRLLTNGISTHYPNRNSRGFAFLKENHGTYST